MRDRLGSASAWLGFAALVLVPVSVAFGRFHALYVAPGDAIAVQYRSVAIYPADAIVALTCLLWLAWKLLSRPRSALRSGTGLLAAAIGLLAVAAFGSVPQAADPVLALGVAGELALLVCFCAAAADLLAYFPCRPMLAVTAVAVIGETLLATWQALTQATAPAGALFNAWSSEYTAHSAGASVVILPLAGRWLRSYGSFAHPNILGGYLALTLAVLLIGGGAGLPRLRQFALVAGFAGLLLSFSRAAGLAALLGSVTWLVVRHGLRPGLLRLSNRARLAAASATLLLAGLGLVRLGNLGALVERNSIETRLSLDSLAWKLIGLRTPVGAGNHVLVEQHVFNFAGPAHNVLLIAMAELGPLGLVACLAIAGAVAVAAWQRRADPRARTGPLVALAALSPLLLLDHYLWTQPPERVLTVWSLVMLVSLGVLDRTALAAAEPVSNESGRAPMLALKRGADLLLAAAGLLVVAPAMALIALMVWLDSGKPVIFRSQRLGRNGRPFTIYKFRSMVRIGEARRITPLGAWLRRFSLDELPQLWNVVRGNMSLVGPRPHEVGEISCDDQVTRRRLSMRPGLTGLWQVTARTNPLFEVRAHYDLAYIDLWSPLLDLMIVWQTVPVVLRGDGGRIVLPEELKLGGSVLKPE